jgi:hypothetical protein
MSVILGLVQSTSEQETKPSYLTLPVRVSSTLPEHIYSKIENFKGDLSFIKFTTNKACLPPLLCPNLSSLTSLSDPSAFPQNSKVPSQISNSLEIGYQSLKYKSHTHTHIHTHRGWSQTCGLQWFSCLSFLSSWDDKPHNHSWLARWYLYGTMKMAVKGKG